MTELETESLARTFSVFDPYYPYGNDAFSTTEIQIDLVSVPNISSAAWRKIDFASEKKDNPLTFLHLHLTNF